MASVPVSSQAAFADRNFKYLLVGPAIFVLLLIGVLLVADAFGHHINRGYVYFAMAFSLLVELMNMRFRKKTRRARPSI